jgi:hypothetical protein
MPQSGEGAHVVSLGQWNIVVIGGEFAVATALHRNGDSLKNYIPSLHTNNISDTTTIKAAIRRFQRRS